MYAVRQILASPKPVDFRGAGQMQHYIYNIRSGYLSQVARGCVIVGAGQRPGSAWQEDFSPGSHSEHFQKASGSWGKAHPDDPYSY